MNRTELLSRLKQLPFSTDDYWVVAGGAMVLYDLRPETGDIDLGCTRRLADQLQAQGYPVSPTPEGTRRICLADDVEIFEEWLYDKIDFVDGFPVISLDGLIAMKRAIGREKDMRDIDLIMAHIAPNR